MQSDDATLAEPLEEALLRAGFSTSEQTASLLRENLRAGQPRLRVLALRGATRRAIVSEDDWLAALSDEEATVRRDAVHLLAYTTDVGEVLAQRLSDLLSDEDELVVEGTAFALGELGFVDSVERLIDVATGHEDARCREAAIAALGVLGDDRGRAAVLGALDDKPPVRRRAIVALANFEGPDIDEALQRAREDRDWQVRAAADQLGRDDY